MAKHSTVAEGEREGLCTVVFPLYVPILLASVKDARGVFYDKERVKEQLLPCWQQGVFLRPPDPVQKILHALTQLPTARLLRLDWLKVIPPPTSCSHSNSRRRA